jgi:hypothetical protein
LRAREKKLQEKKLIPPPLFHSQLSNKIETNKHENQVSSKIGTAGDPLDPSYDGGVAELVERAAELSFPASVGAFFPFWAFFFFQASRKKRKKTHSSPLPAPPPSLPPLHLLPPNSKNEKMKKNGTQQLSSCRAASASPPEASPSPSAPAC